MLALMLLSCTAVRPISAQYDGTSVELNLETGKETVILARAHKQAWSGWRSAADVVAPRSDRFGGARDWQIGAFPEQDLICVRSRELGILECEASGDARLGLRCDGSE